jgi:hypothetical protein
LQVVLSLDPTFERDKHDELFYPFGEAGHRARDFYGDPYTSGAYAPAPTPPPVLKALTLSANSFLVGATQGTIVGNVLNTTSGSTVAFNSLSVAGSLQLVNVGGIWQVQVGPSAPGAPTTITFNLRETLASGANSPHQTSGLSVFEQAVGSSGVLFTDPATVALIQQLRFMQ